MGIYVNGSNQANIKLNNKKVLQVIVNDKEVYSGLPLFAHLFTLKSNYTSKSLVNLFNGVEEKVFNQINNSTDDFLGAGNGTNEIINWYDVLGGSSWDFVKGFAPSLFKENDGSYSADFSGGVKSINSISLKGSTVNAIFTNPTGSNSILLWASGNKALFAIDSKYFSSTWGLSQTGELHINNVPTQSKRRFIQTAVLNGYKLITYKNVSIEGFDWYLNDSDYYDANWNFEGRIKEISTISDTSDEVIDQLIESSLTKHNLT